MAQAYEQIGEHQFTDGRTLVEKMSLTRGFSVLDIGCGTGMLGRHVSDIIGDTGAYTGIDPLAERIKIAQDKNLSPNAVYRDGAAEDLGFIKAASIDAVLLNWVFHWVADKQKAVREIVRVLRPGGQVGITIPAKELSSFAGINRVTDRLLSQAPYKRCVDINKSPQLRYALTATELIELMVNAGMRLSEVEVKAGKRKFSDGWAVVKYMEASLFGNYLGHVPEGLREQAKADIAAEFERRRAEKELAISCYTIYGIFENPTSEYEL